MPHFFIKFPALKLNKLLSAYWVIWTMYPYHWATLLSQRLERGREQTLVFSQFLGLSRRLLISSLITEEIVYRTTGLIPSRREKHHIVGASPCHSGDSEKGQSEIGFSRVKLLRVGRFDSRLSFKETRWIKEASS